MLDVFKVADVLVSHAVRTHGDEVDIIGYYGSYTQGVATSRSDLDIFYIPADGKNPPISRTFLIDGILFDFWPIRWNTMEGFATGQMRGWSSAPALVFHAKVLHSRSQEQAARFAQLKEKVLTLQKPEARTEMIWRSLDMFKYVQAHLGNLHLAIAGGDCTDIRHAGWQVILSVRECLALANQLWFDRGGSHFLSQLSRLRARPADLEQLVVTISTSRDANEIGGAADRLAHGTREVLRELQKSLPSRTTAHERFSVAYPEIKDMLEKVLSACERKDDVPASSAAWFAQYDLSLMLSELTDGGRGHPDFNLYSEFAAHYRELDLPDLMRSTSCGFSKLAEQARLLDDRIQRWLREQGVSLHTFQTLEEFERSA